MAFAPGLPNKKNQGDLRKIKPGMLLDYIIQKHEAERAGTHYDVRFGNEDTGLYSWATRKEIPKSKGRIALFRQPLHTHEYKDFEGEIPSGYGKGKVKKYEEGKVLVTKITPAAIHFTKAHKKFPERFVLVAPKDVADNRWLLVNTTPTETIPYNKVHYTTVRPEKAEKILENLQPGSSVQAKIDGAASLTKLLKDKLEVLSYRTSKTTGGPIIHTERLFQGLRPTAVPPEFVGSVLRGELYGVKGKKAIPPQELGGILNSSVAKSVETQRERGIELKNLVFDIEQKGKTPTKSLPYAERMKMLKELAPYLPEQLHLPEEAQTAAKALKLYKKIQSGKHPLSHEGVVIHPAEGKPTKVKFTDEHDVYVRGMFPGEKKWEGKGVGGFVYSFEPEGKIVGRVGTGFSDELRRAMHKAPGDFIGRVARVRAQDQLPSGALRAPALLALHEDK